MSPKPLPPDAWADFMAGEHDPQETRWTLAVSILLLAAIAALLYWGAQ